jgi:hypothetical protein
MLSYLKENKHIKDENRISELSAETVSDNLLRENVSYSQQTLSVFIYCFKRKFQQLSRDINCDDLMYCYKKEYHQCTADFLGDYLLL